jgi:CRISPR-associated exonuclease Cas4
MSTTIILTLGFFLLLLALYLFWQARRAHQETGLPSGRVVYDDSGREGKTLEKPLFDAVLNLTGKPDYLVEQGKNQIPVEVKSISAPAAPYDSHIYQLAAYCLLVESATHQRPAYGIIRYRNRSIAIDFTTELENHLLDILADMRRQERRVETDRSHDEPKRCASCGYRSSCDQRI